MLSKVMVTSQNVGPSIPSSAFQILHPLTPLKIGDPCPVISPKTLAWVVGSCVVLSACFIPDQKELVHRLDQDGQAERLKELADERMAELKSLETPKTDRAKLRVWLDMADVEVRDDPAVQADRKNMCLVTLTPLEVGAELIAHARRLEPELFDYLANALVTRALGLGRPAEAGSLLTAWFRLRPSWELAGREVQAWRWAVRSDLALKALESAVAAGLDATEAPPGVEELQVQLAVESNQPNYAFDLVSKSYASATADDKPSILRRLVELASAGDRTTEASHLIAEHLKTVPFQTCPLAGAIAMVRNGEAFPDKDDESDYQQYAAAMARWQEWAGHGDVAFNTWLRLAILGNEEAWARALELEDDLMRTDDFALVLAAQIELGRHLDKEPLLAAMLLDEGRTGEAIAHYQAAASRIKDPLPVHEQLGRIYQQSGEWEKAVGSFEDVLKLSATDVEAQKGRAFALVRLRRYEEARTAYVALSAQVPEDAEVQETCAVLCDSLGYARDSLVATQRLLACPGRKATPEEYLELAGQFRVLGDDVGHVAALRQGLVQCPASTRMRFTLAESLANSDQHDEAVQLLAHETLRNDAAAMDLLVSEAMESSNGALAAAFLHNSPPVCLGELPDAQLRLAFLLDQLGRAAESKLIVTNLQRNSRYRQSNVWHELARLSLEFGDTIRAESFETLHISAVGGQDSQAWELLGDIYTAEERPEDATIAYRKAVEVLRPVSAASTPASPQIIQAKAF